MLNQQRCVPRDSRDWKAEAKVSARFLSPEASPCSLQMALFPSCLFMVAPVGVFVLFSCVCGEVRHVSLCVCTYACKCLCTCVHMYVAARGQWHTSSSVACHVTFNIDVFLLFKCVCVWCLCTCVCLYALSHVSAGLTES